MVLPVESLTVQLKVSPNLYVYAAPFLLTNYAEITEHKDNLSQYNASRALLSIAKRKSILQHSLNYTLTTKMVFYKCCLVVITAVVELAFSCNVSSELTADCSNLAK